MNDFASAISYGLMAVGAVLAIAVLNTIPIYLFWNDLLPTLFSIKQISFWQAFEVSVLSASLFKSASSNK
jgi:hypothetical protein